MQACRKLTLSLPEEKVIEAEYGESLLTALQRNGVFVNVGLCNGYGNCNACRVIVAEGVVRQTVKSCRYKLTRDCKVDWVETNEEARFSIAFQADFSMERPLYRWELIQSIRNGHNPHSWLSIQQSLKHSYEFDFGAALSILRRLPLSMQEERECALLLRAGRIVDLIQVQGDVKQVYGLAYDVGTTTLAGYLMDLISGEIVASTATINPQTEIASDLMNRIRYLQTSLPENTGQIFPSPAQELSRMLKNGLQVIANQLLSERAIESQAIYEIVIAGNPLMQQLLLGIPSEGLAVSPYLPATTQSIFCLANDAGLHFQPNCKMYTFPGIGGFVGGDAVAMLLVCLPQEVTDNYMCVDIGTNCEIVLATPERIWSCSAAAGPAFEGGHISYGMRAVKGAIEHVQIDEDIRLEVIGSDTPQGLCGSGLVDAIAELIRVELIDKSGKLLDPSEASKTDCPDFLQERLTTVAGVTCFRLSDKEASNPVYLSQQDIRQFQLAKSAIQSAVMLLLQHAGKNPLDLKEVFLAGAFGNYIQPNRFCELGILPSELCGRITMIGNAAGAGACRALFSAEERSRAERLAAESEHVILADMERFNEAYIENLMFP